MKVLLLITMLLGATLAKPALDDELVNLLTKFLEKKQAGSASGEAGSASGEADGRPRTTLFEGLDKEPFELIPKGVFDFSAPLDVSEMADLKGALSETLNAIGGIANEMVSALRAYDADTSAKKTLEDVAEFICEKIFSLLKERDDADLEPLMKHIFISALKGAIGGTTGADPNEPACDMDADKDRATTCILNKTFLVGYAMQVAIEESFEKLEAEVDGESLRVCDQLFKYLEPRPAPGAQGSIAPPKVDGKKIVEKLAAVTACVRDNMELIKERLPAEIEGGALPLPRLVAANAVMQHIGGHIWWVMTNLGATLDTIGAEIGEPEKMKKMKKEMNNKFLTTKSHYRKKALH